MNAERNAAALGACFACLFAAGTPTADALANADAVQPAPTVQTALNIAPADDVLKLLEQARALASTGKFAEALPIFARVTELSPTNYRGHAGRASMLNFLDRYSEGLAAIERAVALAPDNVMLYYNRGLSLAELGRFEAAIVDFDRASAGRPELPMPYADRAAARMSVGQWQAALRDCETAMKIDPAYIWSRYYRAQLRYLQGDFAGASTDFAAVADHQPDFAAARLWRYVSDRRAGSSPGALRATADTGWPGPLIAYLHGDLDPANLLRKARDQRVPDDERRLSAAHVVIGLDHLFAGRREEAKTAFTRALAFKVPAHFEQQLARAELARESVPVR